MPRKKDYRDGGTDNNQLSPKERMPKQRGYLVFVDELPEGSRISRSPSVDLRSWLGRGVDAWVDSMMRAWLLILDQGAATQSVHSYGGAFKHYLEFLCVEREAALVSEPSKLRPLHISHFIDWLRRKSTLLGWGVQATHNTYSWVKRSLVLLFRMKLVTGDPKDFFPTHPFPHAFGVASQHEAFSEAELTRLAKAIKADLVDVHHGRLELRPSEVIAGRYLIVAMRTGGNVTPLFELSRHAIRPGLIPGTRVASVLKHRAKKGIGLLLTGQVREECVYVPADSVAVLDRTLRETAHLVDEAAPALKDRIWLFRSVGPNKGEVRCLAIDSLGSAVESLVKRRALIGDDGRLLRVNVSRLRKSFGKRAFRLTNGDVVATANLLGNKARVADSQYLNPDAELLAEAGVFFSAELLARLRGNQVNAAVIPILDSNAKSESRSDTPVAGCKDSLSGEYAPNDGYTHCDSFVMCLFCFSFAIVGELNELWRLFSFQLLVPMQY
jgi:hypothetical protein